ncbi:hypothetical protein K435DRAFT_585657, partial [Dendrothele bispora CBS 962.96]
LGKIPLVVGMPVVITHNFDVGGGIVNGTYGILKSVEYKIEDCKRYATSCIITLPNLIGSPMTGLTEFEVPVLQQSSTLKFVH